MKTLLEVILLISWIAILGFMLANLFAAFPWVFATFVIITIALVCTKTFTASLDTE